MNTDCFFLVQVTMQMRYRFNGVLDGATLFLLNLRVRIYETRIETHVNDLPLSNYLKR